MGIVLGCQPLISYNMGAKNYGRVKALYLYILLCTAVISLIFTAVIEGAPRAVVGLFGEPKDVDSTAYWNFSTRLFRIFLMFVTSSLVRDLVCFVPLCCILPAFYGIEGILWAGPIADAIAIIVAVTLTAVYWHKMKKEGCSAD